MSPRLYCPKGKVKSDVCDDGKQPTVEEIWNRISESRTPPVKNKVRANTRGSCSLASTFLAAMLRADSEGRKGERRERLWQRARQVVAHTGLGAVEVPSAWILGIFLK